ncbi:olfactory receptor 52N5-like, partial [Plectropomus leopardus]|uniref:olfactory receptor 52N5-like n=1 Tax=Plectropomus leopardus TaxID=160734 RepID=UPI001C4CBDFD
AACFLQIFCLYSYGNIEVLNLAVMSYDRYLAICFPLQYKTRMTTKKVFLLIALNWFSPFLVFAVLILIIVPLQLCGNIINKVYCDYYLIVKMSCYDTTVYNTYGLIYIFLTVSWTLSLIGYSYIKILKVCFSGSRQTRQKAVSTCSPHLASLLNFFVGASFEIVQSRFDMSNTPIMLRIFLSLYFLTCPPLFNPVLYGLKLSKIRVLCKNVIRVSGQQIASVLASERLHRTVISP